MKNFIILFTVQGMEKFLVRTQNRERPPPVTEETGSTAASNKPQAKQARVDIDSDDIPSVPGLRRRLLNMIRMNKTVFNILAKGSLSAGQIIKFPQTTINDKLRRFNPSLFVSTLVSV